MAQEGEKPIPQEELDAFSRTAERAKKDESAPKDKEIESVKLTDEQAEKLRKKLESL